MKIVSVEGNIGAGKTTLIRMLKERMPEAEFLLEPIEKWQDVGGENLLESFYKDSSRYAFIFQCRAFMTRIKQLEEKMADPDCKDTIIIERSWFSDRMCFSQVLRDDGTITEMEWIVYKELFDQMFNFIKKAKMNINKYIYVKCDTSVVEKRIKKRNRGEETSIPTDYLEKLNVKHESWLNGRNDVLVIRSDDFFVNYMEDPTKFSIVVSKVRNFLEDDTYETINNIIDRVCDKVCDNIKKVQEIFKTNFFSIITFFHNYISPATVCLFIFGPVMLLEIGMFETGIIGLILNIIVLLMFYGGLTRNMDNMCREFDYVMLSEDEQNY